MSEVNLKTTQILELLGKDGEELLNFSNPKISKDYLTLPSDDFVDKVFVNSDRNNRVLGNLNRLYNSGRLSGPGICLSFR